MEGAPSDAEVGWAVGNRRVVQGQRLSDESMNHLHGGRCDDRSIVLRELQRDLAVEVLGKQRPAGHLVGKRRVRLRA